MVKHVIFVGTRAEMEDWCRQEWKCSANRAEVDRRITWVGNVPYAWSKVAGLRGCTLVTTGTVRPDDATWDLIQAACQ